MTIAQLLDALHLWLHRGAGVRIDRDLARACESFDWATLDEAELQSHERESLETLRAWFHGQRVDLIGSASDFHESKTINECNAVDDQVERLDGVRPNRDF